MPLSDLHPMAKGKQLPSGQHRTITPCSTDLFFTPDNDFMELVWENGHVIAQNQSKIRPTKYPDSSSSPHHILTSYDEDATYLKMPTYGTPLDMVDFPLTLTSDKKMGLNQVDDIIMPWLSSPIINDSLQSKFYPTLVPEASGLTYINQNNPNNFSSIEKTTTCGLGFNKEESHNNAIFEQQETSSLSMPGVPEIANKNITRFCSSNVITQGSELLSVSSGRSLTNFSCFDSIGSMPSPQVLSKNKDMDSFESSDNHFCTMSNSSMSAIQIQCERALHNNQPSLVISKPQSHILQEKAIRSKKSWSPTCAEGSAIGKPDYEINREPIVASSSACSGSTMEGASNDLKCIKKRKFCENEESEGPSEGIEDESGDVNEEAPAPRCTVSKRGRAAEVHNLSERRRRDRINEKMRALQELIPNCNKVDKASMLDEAIEYLKALQLQVQMMSMRTGALCVPAPVMFPTAHMNHFPHMGVGFGMGFGMMDMYYHQQVAAAAATMESNPSSIHCPNSKGIQVQTTGAATTAATASQVMEEGEKIRKQYENWFHSLHHHM